MFIVKRGYVTVAAAVADDDDVTSRNADEQQ